MIYFEPEGFEEYYDYILKGGASKEYYIDPDCQQDIGKTCYYNLLTKFLNCRECEVIAQEEQLQYLPPKKAKNTSEEEQRSLQADDYKIAVIKNEEKIFRLTSDQFGFSAVEDIFLNVSKREKYPLSRMMLLSQNEDEEKQKNVRKQIAEYVKKSRTMGSAFVWAISIESGRCPYNQSRGIRCYIEDRVDLTLLEIKHALDGEYDKGKFTSDVLYSEYNKNEIMREWLKHFKTFDNYIRYFMLEPFVIDTKDGMLPIDIVSGEPMDTKAVEEYKVSEEKQLQSLNLEELQEVVERVEKMILKRTQSMEEIILQGGSNDF